MYHHGLVNILIIEELCRRNESWKNFITQNKFHEQSNEIVASNQIAQGDKNKKEGLDEDLRSPGAEEIISPLEY